MSSIVNKVKDALHSDKSSTQHTTHNKSSGAPEGTYGPHSTRAANAADPRVDSDADRSHNMGARTAGHGEYGSSTGGYTQGTTGHTGIGSSGMTGSSGTREGEFGPHSNRVANALDPRVDSDRDGSHNTNNYSTGTTGMSGLGSSGMTGTHGTREGEHGPHSSRIANAADPRVDSDRDGSRTAGNTGYSTGNTGYSTGNTGYSTGNTGYSTGATGTSGFGTTGYTGTTGHHAGSGVTGMTGTHGDPTGTHGPHSSRVANAADPRIDSDRDGRAGVGHHAPGPAPNTAGPHKSDMLNKMDPRVDSDMDGSKTTGGNRTYQQGGSSGLTGSRDPTDAAQVPPSVLQAHIGAPSIEHGDHSHGRDRRNSLATHQEGFSGI